jgi:hypothetical protein
MRKSKSAVSRKRCRNCDKHSEDRRNTEFVVGCLFGTMLKISSKNIAL